MMDKGAPSEADRTTAAQLPTIGSRSAKSPVGYGASRRRFNLALLLLPLALAGQAAATPARASQPVKLLAMGDSLTAGYGLPADQAFPARLAAALKAQGIDAVVINAGVSGDTSAGGLARIDWSLAEKPDFAILELGSNDGLRGIDPKRTYDNLDGILGRFSQSGVPVLFTGMYAPPNLGRDYGREFNAVFPRLAEKHGVLFYPFFLDGVAAEADLNQADGIHPNARGVDIIVERLLPSVKKLIGAPS
jgi:acyl-CoA thioesterase-1